MQEKINLKKRKNIKKYLTGAIGFFGLVYILKSQTYAMIFNSKKNKNHKFQIDGETGLEINSNNDTIINGSLQLTDGLKDNNVSTAIQLGDSSNTSYNTINKTIIGSTNELESTKASKSFVIAMS